MKKVDKWTKLKFRTYALEMNRQEAEDKDARMCMNVCVYVSVYVCVFNLFTRQTLKMSKRFQLILRL